MATPIYSDVITQINTYIIANGNNEITANVLNPILKIITDFSNNTIGDLADLTTDENDNVVNALNSLKVNISNISDGSVKLYTGYDDPNITPPPFYNYGDFFMQLGLIFDDPITLWQWDGYNWNSYLSTITQSVREGFTETTPSEDAVFNAISASSTSVPDATDSVKGIVKLAGDLAGTADLPTVPNKQNYAIARTGSTIKFDTPAIYNSPSSPSTSNLSDDLTGARIGIIQPIYINKAVEPTYPAGWVKIGTGTYTPSSLNMICCEWVGGTRVNYWITKA